MTDEFGAPPKGGWSKLVPELLVSDIDASLSFWCGVLAFEIAYQRPAEKFVYLQRPEGIQIMLCERSGKWETAPLDQPYGRGTMFQLYVEDWDDLFAAVNAAGWPLHSGPREVWRRHGDREGGQREFFVQDPDGYLLMIAQMIGQRPIAGF
jgi:catechol 2,3-dioxygenase-like lactoylglutathione lyase family enzyme